VGAGSPWLQAAVLHLIGCKIFFCLPVFVAIFGLGYGKGMNYGVASQVQLLKLIFFFGN
jgi:hypothetical protein